MAMLEPSQQTFWQETELPLMSSRAASRAKTLALPENSAGLARERGLASGLKSSAWLASYDPATSSWRTSQRCLLAQANNEADGLAVFSETWPNAGMMRNGETYQLAWSLPPTGESGSGLWPTPRTCSAMAATITPESAWNAGRFPNLETMVGRRLWPTPTKSDGPKWGYHISKENAESRNARGKQIMLAHAVSLETEGGGTLNPPWVEWLMGFPIGWTDLQPSETP